MNLGDDDRRFWLSGLGPLSRFYWAWRVWRIRRWLKKQVHYERITGPKADQLREFITKEETK
jgi:hypothetical protein